MNKAQLTALAAGLGLALTACGDESSAVEMDNLDTTGAPIRMLENRLAVVTAFRSNNTNQLSGPRRVDCITAFGGEHVVDRLNGFRENAANLDNFVARLGVGCRRYIDRPGRYIPSTRQGLRNLFSGPAWRVPGTLVQVPPQTNRVAMGVRLTLNNGGGYIKNVRLLHTPVIGPGVHTAVTLTPPVNNYGGPTHDARCPQGTVLTGLETRFSMNNGKMRQLLLRCRRLDD